MSFSLAINQDRLVETFNLDPYNNLVKGNVVLLALNPNRHSIRRNLQFKCFQHFLCESLLYRGCLCQSRLRSRSSCLPNPSRLRILSFDCTTQCARTPALASFHAHSCETRQDCSVRCRLTHFFSCCRHVLYLSNRYGEGVTVRPVLPVDLNDIKSFLQNMAGHAATIDELHQPFIEKVPQYQSFVVEQRNQVVGLAVLEKCTNSQEIMDQFDVDVLISLGRQELQNQFAILRRLVLNPLFDAQARWIVEVILFFSIM